MTTTRYAVILGILTGLFTLRVIGQAVVAFADASFLPPIEQWSSGLIPYHFFLLPTQLVMIVGMGFIVRDLARGRGTIAIPSRRAGAFLLWFSYLYALSMVTRYVVTMTIYPERRWFGHTIPIWFHLVLAAFVYTLGRYHVDHMPVTSGAGRTA